MCYRAFETDRLHLIPTTSDHAMFILKLLNSPKWFKFIGDRNVQSLEAAHAYIQDRIVSQFDRLGFGNYTLVLKNDGVLIGACGLYDREGIDGIDLGFALLPDLEKQGYAYEAARKIMEVASTKFKLNTIRAITKAENIDSRKLLEKLGLVYEKTVRLGDDNQEFLVYQASLYEKN